MNLRCYYFAAGSYILKFKEALLEIADIKRRRDVNSCRFTLNSCTKAEWKYTDLTICFRTISRKIKRKRCIINLKIVLSFFLYIFLYCLKYCSINLI